MEQESLPTEIILNNPRRSLGSVYLDWTPQPGAYVAFEGKTYTVLERRHRYQLKTNRYQLHKVDLYVQTAQPSGERSFLRDRWVLGDVTCHYNAQSELLRCAVNPSGPCKSCCFYESRIGSGEGY